uniref:Uncharacterized protein n=1 Tax=Oryza punctata TaxID=4537 RepID=A0A0E0JH64_ORYPU
MSRRQRRRIFLDYTSLFSGNCVLLQQFSLYVVLAPRPSRKPSLLVSSDIGEDSWWSPTSPTHASPRTLVHDALSCVHGYSLAPLACYRLDYLNINTPDFGYNNHGYSTHDFIDHGSLTSLNVNLG